MILAADASGGRKLVGGAPSKKPGFHVPMGDVMPGLYLPTRLTDFQSLSILV